MSKVKISAVVVVKNEEKNIRRCLSSIKSLVDEIIIVDEESTDGTVKIAKEYTDKVYSHKSVGFVEPARNFSINKTTGDWILLLDADEEIRKELLENLRGIAKKGDTDYVLIPRKNLTFNSWIQNSGWWPDYQVRFFKKGKVHWREKIHSVPELSGKEIKLDPIEENAIIHHNYDSVSQFLSKLDQYTTIEADQAEEQFELANLINKPLNEFVSRYFLHKGYKDGIHGLGLSVLMAFYLFVVELKLWEKTGFPDKEPEEVVEIVRKETKNANKLIRYWFFTAKLSDTKNPLKKIGLKILRKR